MPSYHAQRGQQRKLSTHGAAAPKPVARSVRPTERLCSDLRVWISYYNSHQVGEFSWRNSSGPLLGGLLLGEIHRG